MELIDGVVGFVEVGGDNEEGAAELLLHNGGEDEGAGAPLAGGGDVAGVGEAAGEFCGDWRGGNRVQKWLDFDRLAGHARNGASRRRFWPLF